MPNLPLITLFGNHEYSNVELILAFIVDSNIWLKRTIDVFCDKLVVTLALSNLWFFAKLSAMCRHNTSLSPWVRWGFFNAWMIHRRVLIGLTNEQKNIPLNALWGTFGKPGELLFSTASTDHKKVWLLGTVVAQDFCTVLSLYVSVCWTWGFALCKWVHVWATLGKYVSV